MDNQDLFAPDTTTAALTVLSMGAGQDSSALLELYVRDHQWREQWAPGDFVVICSDTGCEYPATYKNIERMEELCQREGVEFYHITPDMGFHSPSWQSLQHFFKLKSCVSSVAYPKTCSDRLKVKVIYNFLSSLVSERYGMQPGKAGLRQYAKTYGKINMIIGIAAGEEKRMSDASSHGARWYRESIQHCYPLVEMGWGRKECQAYLHSLGLRVEPSNCMFCPFQTEPEIEYLRRFYPSKLSEWIDFERAKLAKWRHLENVIATDKDGTPKRDRNGNIKTVNRNLGVYGLTTLEEKVRDAKDKYNQWSDERIIDYRYSHGHCVSTSF